MATLKRAKKSQKKSRKGKKGGKYGKGGKGGKKDKDGYETVEPVPAAGDNDQQTFDSDNDYYYNNGDDVNEDGDFNG